MTNTQAPPKPWYRYMKAPEPSAALLALQEQGFELPVRETILVSPRINSSPADLDTFCLPAKSLEPYTTNSSQLYNRRRQHSSSSSDADSIETTITHILTLYANRSENSLRSTYEETYLHLYDSDEDSTPLLTVHQPKAYRDTIAPLLERQFSGDKLDVLSTASPMSFTSPLVLSHSNTNASVSALSLTLDQYPDLPANTSILASSSQNSIQTTPTTLTLSDQAQWAVQEFVRQEVLLEVPDVRDASSWYDCLLSPVSPEDSESNSQNCNLSTLLSETTIGYQRDLTFDALVPPASKVSPNKFPVVLVSSKHADEVGGGTTKNADRHDSNSVPGEILISSLTARSLEPTTRLHRSIPPEFGDSLLQLPQNRHAATTAHNPAKTSLNSTPMFRHVDWTLSKSPRELVDSDQTSRPSSPFSKTSLQFAPGMIGAQLKQAWHSSLGRRNEKTSAQKVRTHSEPSELFHPHWLNDDFETYRYPYWKSRTSVTTQDGAVPSHGVQRNNLQDLSWGSAKHKLEQNLRTAEDSFDVWVRGGRPVLPSGGMEGQQTVEPQAYDTTVTASNFGKHISNQEQKNDECEGRSGTENGSKTKGNSEGTVRPAFKEQTPITHEQNEDRGLKTGGAIYEPKLGQSENHTSVTVARVETLLPCPGEHSTQSPKAYSEAKPQSSRDVSVWYNNDLFEMGGGSKRRSGLASRLMLSSDERRRRKVKESIIVLGADTLRINK